MALSPANSHGDGYPLSLTGATAATRYVGGTASGAPASGTFAVGDFSIDQTGAVYVCTVAGTPGTWVAVSGGSSGADPVHTLFGDPTGSDFEFTTSSLTGLTALGTPAAENADTTVPGAYYIRNMSAGTNLNGRYFSAPSAPWTAIVCLLDSAPSATGSNYFASGMFVAETGPGALDVIEAIPNGAAMRLSRYTNPTSYGTTVASVSYGAKPPLYLGIRANSATDVDYVWSGNGYVWKTITTARNPGVNLDLIGVGCSPENAAGIAVAYDYIRVWTSALTFPGFI
jgi:hypothetical protein